MMVRVSERRDLNEKALAVAACFVLMKIVSLMHGKKKRKPFRETERKRKREEREREERERKREERERERKRKREERERESERERKERGGSFFASVSMLFGALFFPFAIEVAALKQIHSGKEHPLKILGITVEILSSLHS